MFRDENAPRTAMPQGGVRKTTSSTSAHRQPETRCGKCNEIAIEINLLIDGEELTMRSCSNCDHRSWHQGGAQVALDGVLADLSSSPTRYRRDLANR